MAVNVAVPHSTPVGVPDQLNNGTAPRAVSRVDFTTYHNVIDGQLSGTDRTRRTVDPATLELNPEVPVSTKQDVERAVAAAQKAGEAWAEVPWLDRKKAIEAYAEAVEAHIAEIAEIQVREMGCPLPMAEGDVQWGVGWMRGFCELPQPGDIIESSQDRHVVERYTPIGVAVGIVPWNGPVVLACGKIAPALLTGNTLILKPSPFAPYTCLKLAEIGLQFFPPGVLQALSGEDDLGPWLTAHPAIGKVSFTGSGNTAKRVVEACSSHLKRVSTELGGNDPAIVCDDVDPVVVGRKVATVAMLRSGQFCIAIKRVYIHEKIYDAVLAEIVKYVGTVKVDNGLDEGTVVGPLANEPQYERVKDLLADIEQTKLDVLPKNGQPIDGLKGFFIRPIVINNPPDDSRVVVEEPFGPILPVMKWSDEADVIQRANNTEYGLGASVWSGDLVRASRIANKLQAGNVWINTHAEIQASTAFAGHKQSGYGSELGADGLKGWCNVQALYTRPL
ncbi:aldehyde dehydrogenase [Xylaria arbuscula]|nr:aldehyde dehydrogenase [Xylaria arbuscula]